MVVAVAVDTGAARIQGARKRARVRWRSILNCRLEMHGIGEIEIGSMNSDRILRSGRTFYLDRHLLYVRPQNAICF